MRGNTHHNNTAVSLFEEWSGANLHGFQLSGYFRFLSLHGIGQEHRAIWPKSPERK